MFEFDLTAYLAALERRHLASLTRPELTRALRALSSCYVERREKLTSGAPLDGVGKRAAFALFYGPLHFRTTTRVVNATGADRWPIDRIADLGCGTGTAGAAWSLAHQQHPPVDGIERNSWAVREANWTYREVGVRGSARVGDIARDISIGRATAPAILLAYVVNELPVDGRARLLELVTRRVSAGVRLLVVEPIARRLSRERWFEDWMARLAPAGARADEWRFAADLPPLLRDLAKGAGLDPRELTARTLSVPGVSPSNSPPALL